MLYTNAKMITMAGDPIPKGFLLVEGGMIREIGDMQDCPPGERRDLAGYAVYPGFVDAHSHLGMWEDGLDFEGDDGNEDTDPVTPQLRALDAVNPLDRCFAEAAAAGITTVLTGPGSANPIAGSWVALKTVGSCVDDMIVREPVGMKFALGENPKRVYNEKSQTPITRMGIAAVIREQLYKAKRYAADLARAREEEDAPPEYDAKCEALLPLLRRECKAFFHCHRADDIFTARRIAAEFQLDCVYIHATEGALIADALAGENIVMGPLLCDRSKPELRAHSIASPAAVSRAGGKVALCTDHPVVPIQYLPLSCALAVRGGLPREQALASITRNAAEIAGISDRVGTLQVGKDADFVAFPIEEDIFSPYAAPSLVVVNGRELNKEG